MLAMNGYDAARAIKQHPRGAGVPIIFVTSIFQDPENVRRGYEVGAVDYLFRPVDSQMLRSKVSVFIDLHRQKALLESEIAQRRRTEEALRRAEEKYRAIFERAVEASSSVPWTGPSWRSTRPWPVSWVTSPPRR
jgi:response regulator RpfG family c-di-GMP phosphodiesterase